MPIAFLVFYLVIRPQSINDMVCVSFPLKMGQVDGWKQKKSYILPVGYLTCYAKHALRTTNISSK